jgi:hypothetical protein
VLVTAAVPEDIPSLLTGAHFRVSAGTLTEVADQAGTADQTAAPAVTQTGTRAEDPDAP